MCSNSIMVIMLMQQDAAISPPYHQLNHVRNCTIPKWYRINAVCLSPLHSLHMSIKRCTRVTKYNQQHWNVWWKWGGCGQRALNRTSHELLHCVHHDSDFHLSLFVKLFQLLSPFQNYLHLYQTFMLSFLIISAHLVSSFNIPYFRPYGDIISFVVILFSLYY